MRAGRKAYGYNLSFPSPWVIDILGKLDFDFVFIDGEHGPFGLDQLEDLCRTAERHNLTTIARVPDIGSSTILRYLDRGIMGILGPHIATEADARQLVRACYFGPLGERSFGANRGTDYNAGIADKAAYYREANEPPALGGSPLVRHAQYGGDDRQRGDGPLPDLASRHVGGRSWVAAILDGAA
jgi:4-hydroxy-2-oxoheptanedioate aldolase